MQSSPSPGDAGTPDVPQESQPAGPPDLGSFPAPQSPASELRKIERPSPLTGLANAWLAVVAVAFVLGRELIENNFETGDVLGTFGLIVVGGLAAIAVIALLVGIIQWRTTTFIVDHEFRIERRFISSSTTRIDFTKVQSVDIQRPLIARLLGLAEVRIEVGAQSNQTLRFLKKERADSLRDHLLEKMGPTSPGAPRTGQVGYSGHEAGAPGQAHSQGRPAGDAPAPFEEAEARTVYKARPGTIVLGAFLSLGIGSLIILGILVVALILVPGGVAFLWLALVGLVWQVPGALIKNWAFTIKTVPRGLRVQRGLFTTVQMTLRPDRVQAVGFSQNIWQRLAGLYTVHLTVLGNASLDESENNIDVLLPYGKWEEARFILHLVWPHADIEQLRWRPQPEKARWLTWFARHDSSVLDDLMATRSRMLGQSIQIVPHARVQGIGIKQGPLQRRLGLADVHPHTTGGPVDVRARNLTTEDARRLFQLELRLSTAARKDRSQELYASSSEPQPGPAPGASPFASPTPPTT